MKVGLKRRFLLAALACAAAGLAAFFPLAGGKAPSTPAPRVAGLDLSTYSALPLASELDLLFIHHSIGAQLLADPGPEMTGGTTHPSGGGLRKLLEANGYRVHTATYGSRLGEDTDLFDWLPKFREQMPALLATERQDTALEGGRRNRVVVFKSCYPNNRFTGRGSEPGNPSGPELTVANARATLKALLPVFERHPDTLFVYLTIPPLAGDLGRDFPIRRLARTLLGKPSPAERLGRHGDLARELDAWVVARDGWLAGYPRNNVAVFDLYDVLTANGASNFLEYTSKKGDSHPSAEGNAKVAALLVPFLNRAVRRAGLAGELAAGNAAAAP